VTTPEGVAAGEAATAEVRALLRRADEAAKAAPDLAVEGARERVARLLAEARERLLDVTDTDVQLDLAAQVARRAADLDREALHEVLSPSPGVRRAPTRTGSGPGEVSPERVPPGQHLTAGWPVLHVGQRHRRSATRPLARGDRPRAARVRAHRGRAARASADGSTDQRPPLRDGLVAARQRLGGRPPGRPARPRRPPPEATHLVASGHPAYSANLDLEAVHGPTTSWSPGRTTVRPLDRAHGGPLRLVVPARYGWKSVKWLTELRLTDHDVPRLLGGTRVPRRRRPVA
jgi:DMSO/TMAO reductase YedYZ molybdopterin-dependent catalytic subunit